MSETRTGELEAWREEARRRLEALQVEIVERQREADEMRERLTLLDRLLSLERGAAGAESGPAPDMPVDLLDACEAIVRGAGEPLHVRTLYEALVDRRVPIPGRGTEANLIVRLQRSDGRFIRTGRGTYGLPEFGIPEAKPVRQRKRTRRK